MKRLCCVGALMTALLGTGLHFLYTWQPIALFGLFAPVNESVWEHLKLLVWPFLLVCGLLAHWAPSRPSFWAAACGSLLVMPPVLLGIWYTARYGLGVESVAFDIGLYYLVIALGFLLLCRWEQVAWTERQVGILVMLAGLWGGMLLIGSAAPLDRPMFEA